MKHTIAIIAPMVDENQYHLDYSLKLKNTNRELTLATIYELMSSGFNTEILGKIPSKRDMPPAASYYLTSLLRSNGYHTVMSYQCNETSLRRIASENPLAVCLSTTMILSYASLEHFVEQIRMYLPDVFLIVGGVYVWKSFQLQDIGKELFESKVSSAQLLFQPGTHKINADLFIIAPHGKIALLDSLKELEKGSGANFRQIPNIALPQDEGFFYTKVTVENVDYDNDFTQWEYIDEIPDQIPVRTSIGCPFRCRFCDFYQLYPKIHFRSKESLTRELVSIKKRIGDLPAIVHASDDNIFINQKRVHDVTQAFIDAGISRWMGFMRASSVNDSNIEQIRQSGLLISLLGIESGDAGQLERMNKKQDLAEMKKGIELLDRNGITALMTFVVGFPGEDDTTIQNTAGFINSLDIGTASSSYLLFPLSISPFSDLAKPEYRKKWNIKGMMDKWSHYTMNSEQSIEAGLELFKQVNNVPYHYTQERTFYNRELFDDFQRKELFGLRNNLTKLLLANASKKKVQQVLGKMAMVMGVGEIVPSEEFIEEIGF